MSVNLTSGAISKIVTGKCTENDLYKPVLQVINSARFSVSSESGKQLYLVALSDGSFFQFGYIPCEIIMSKKLQIDSIVQLTKFHLTKLLNSKDEFITKSYISVCDLNLLCSKCDIVGDPKRLPDNKTPLVERSTPTILDEDQIHANSHHVEEPPTIKQKQDHVDSLPNEDIDYSHNVEEPPTSIQNPSTSTQKCSSSSPTQNKKRKLQSSDDIISGFGKDISKLVNMIVEKTIEDGLGACYKKLETLEEDVSKLTRMMMEKNKEDDMGACIEKLDKMGWGAEEPIYDTALLLFLKGADYRKLWLHLKPQCCGKWVKIAGSIFGLLD